MLARKPFSKGFSAEVFMAHSKYEPYKSVVKRMNPNVVGTFETEVKVLIDLGSHPNVVNLLGVISVEEFKEIHGKVTWERRMDIIIL
ncbi:hypothetical protein FRX31_002766 [Thalictrum thalictroides]|uniref:Protein kinase domain-containing protein n=1 Tax=Thalictrum thalictroides TaxID=46969 RepID=A0A7J6XF44_THATH|nr:hypothetical protein FRX31_002766 [Thalictrum thalictroides]